MIQVKNPHYCLDKNDNIFLLRKKEYEKIVDIVNKIVSPVTEIGFEISDIHIKDSRTMSGELNKTIKDILVIRIKKGQYELDLSMAIPKLIQDNYIIIGGRKKIPVFQLIDLPLVMRGKSIKFRSNVATIMVSQKSKTEESLSIRFSYFGKNIPFSTLCLAYYGMDALIEKYDLHNLKIEENEKDKKVILLSEIKEVMEESSDYTQDDFIRELGRYYTRYDAKTKGNDILYSLDLIPKVDFLSCQFLDNENIIDVLIDSLDNNKEINDLDIRNKRIRCFEYVIYSAISRAIFSLCISNRTSRQPKFNTNTNQIIAACNVSDIVQFDFSINPIEELTKLTRTSILGEGGFKRENTPRHLRDISQSMYGRLCPIDTPDRENCGILQSLVPGVKLDNNWRFSEEIKETSPISIPVSFIPFCEHDDQTRLQMACSQMRQAIMLKDFDTPLIESGNEGLYTKHTQFIKIAKYDGEVVYIDKDYLFVKYNNGENDVFDIGIRYIYTTNIDLFKIYIKEGDKFKKGEILAESYFCKDGKICFGKNLLTAIVPYFGYNFEDGIVLSERVVSEGLFSTIQSIDLSFEIPENKVLLSLKEGCYEPLPEKFKLLEKGSAYAKLKDISFDKPYSIFNKHETLEVEKRVLITNINIFPNNWCREIPEYSNWLEKKIEEQKQEEDDLISILKDKFGSEDTKKFIKQKQLNISSFSGKFRSKKQKILGTNVDITAIFYQNIKVGDKIANRHGNKGIISKIVPIEKMPRTKDGRYIDICINPFGIISRMNIGQVFELHLSMALVELKEKLLNMFLEKVPIEKIKRKILGFVYLCDNTENSWYFNQFKNQLENIEIDEKFIKELTIIQPPSESVDAKTLFKCLKYTGTEPEKYIFDPISNEWIQNPIAVGYIYFFRMVHIAENKLTYRGLGSYSRKTLQPLGGRKLKGGQRCGEMETACLIAHDAMENLSEFFTTKSDCIDLKNKHVKGFIRDEEKMNPSKVDSTPESVKVLKYYLRIIGVEY